LAGSGRQAGGPAFAWLRPGRRLTCFSASFLKNNLMEPIEPIEPMEHLARRPKNDIFRAGEMNEIKN
jgi:hypothetical protein